MANKINYISVILVLRGGGGGGRKGKIDLTGGDLISMGYWGVIFEDWNLQKYRTHVVFPM